MNSRQVLTALILLLVSLGPITLNAERPRMDGPTQAALNQFRSKAATMVASVANNKGVTAEQVTASYNGQLSLSPQRANTVMVVRNRAEQAAWAEMDPPSRSLLKSFFDTAR